MIDRPLLLEISPLAASETFTQRRRRRTGAGSLHANASVNGATECSHTFAHYYNIFVVHKKKSYGAQCQHASYVEKSTNERYEIISYTEDKL